MIKYAETYRGVSKTHQSNVAEWIKSNKETLKSISVEGKTRFLIDGRFWRIHNSETEKGGVVLRSRWSQFLYFVEYIPHDHGQYGKIEFHRIRNKPFRSVEENMKVQDLEF